MKVNDLVAITSADIHPKVRSDYLSLLRLASGPRVMLLFANENQNARCQCQDSHYDGRDGDVEQQSDSGENQVDGEQSIPRFLVMFMALF